MRQCDCSARGAVVAATTLGNLDIAPGRHQSRDTRFHLMLQPTLGF